MTDAECEAEIQADIRLATGLLPGVRLFRNNRGMLYDANGRPVRYGVGDPGGSDLIGFRSVTITPEMVWQNIAVFTALEVKKPGWVPRNAADRKRFDDQVRFINMVISFGGIAGIVRSPDDALGLLKARRA